MITIIDQQAADLLGGAHRSEIETEAGTTDAATEETTSSADETEAMPEEVDGERADNSDGVFG